MQSAAASADLLNLCAFTAQNVLPTVPVCLANAYAPGLLATQGTFSPTGPCVNYTDTVQKATGMLGNQGFIDTGNTAWMLAASAFVMISKKPTVLLGGTNIGAKSDAGGWLLLRGPGGS